MIEFNFLKSKGLLVLLVLFVFILILAFFFGDGGIIEIIKSRARVEELKKKVSQLEIEKDKLIKEISDLEKNPNTLEWKAREKLWLMKKNEKVVIFVNNKTGGKVQGNTTNNGQSGTDGSKTDGKVEEPKEK